MRLIGKSKLVKLKSKSIGNKNLCIEIDRLIKDIETNEWRNEIELKKTRVDADCVHSDGFYFLNISIHRTMILFEFHDDNEATVVWVGNHQDYDRTFKNNKNTIEKWLKSRNYI
jgi:mRNA interferase HigB